MSKIDVNEINFQEELCKYKKYKNRFFQIKLTVEMLKSFEFFMKIKNVLPKSFFSLKKVISLGNKQELYKWTGVNAAFIAGKRCHARIKPSQS